MKLLSCICFFLSIGTLFSQNLEFSPTILQNVFYDHTDKSNPHTQTTYSEPEWGYGINIALDNWHLKDTAEYPWALRFELNYSHISGDFKCSSGGLGGSATQEASITKDMIGIGLLPFNIRIMNIAQINLGFEGNYRIYSTISGRTYSWQMYQASKEATIDPNSKAFNMNFSFGLIGRFAFRLPISEKVSLEPFYRFYFGLLSEVDNFAGTKSFRNIFGVSFVWEL